MKFISPMHFCLAAVWLSSAMPHALTAAIESKTAPYPTFGSIERLDPAMDALLEPDARMEELATGFYWTEGPVWWPEEGMLLFSDVPQNTVFSWKEGRGIGIYLRPSGYTGEHYVGTGPGSNGLMLDSEGNLILCQHGDRRVARLDRKIAVFETIADRFEGKRFNSPNDLVFDRRGNLYFTDPTYGWDKSVPRELDFSGVYRVSPEGDVCLLTQEIPWPNGIALSPDEKTLYVSNSGYQDTYIKAFPIEADGKLGASRLFFNSTALAKENLPGSNDGMCIDQLGNLWTTAPDGVIILSPEGKHLGTLHTGEPNGNCTFGEDGSTLFIMANHSILRIRTHVKGLGF